MPNIRRPFDRTSTVASSFARINGLRSGRTTIPVPSPTELVRAARNASVVTGSRMGSSGSIDDGGARGAGTTTCSETQMDSTPTASAASARNTSIPRLVYGPEFAEQTPIFTEDASLTTLSPDLTPPRAAAVPAPAPGPLGTVAPGRPCGPARRGDGRSVPRGTWGRLPHVREPSLDQRLHGAGVVDLEL